MVLLGPRPDPGLDLTLAETKQLWSFFAHGSVQSVETRRHLHRSWGLCSRHAWSCVMAEYAVRLRPLSTAVLYEDLVGRAAAALARPATPGVSRARRLRPRASCLTCDYVSESRHDGSYEQRRERINGRSLFRAALEDTSEVWAERACPACVGGGGVPCRPHLIEGVLEPEPDLPEHLEDLQRRLQGFIRSLTWHGPTASPDERVSWVEAIGWFAGWQVPRAALAAPT